MKGIVSGMLVKGIVVAGWTTGAAVAGNHSMVDTMI